MKKIIVICLIGTAWTSAHAQNKAATTNFKKTPNNLEYSFLRDKKDGKTASVGDYIEVHIKMSVNNTSVGDSVLFDSKSANNGQPVPYQLPAPAYKGDLSEGLMLMTAGDSALFRMPVDSIPNLASQNPAWYKAGSGQKIVYDISLVSVKTQEQMKTEAEAHAAKQKAIDDKLIADYLKKNNITATKTPSGLYYKITQEGTGETAKAGQMVTVNYTGKTMDGTPFDSNVDPQFQHVQPFSFGLGQGQVIKGWDEGVALLKKGSKATLYIPSTMAYGERGAGDKIPANAVLIFDVEVTDIAAAGKN